MAVKKTTTIKKTVSKKPVTKAAVAKVKLTETKPLVQPAALPKLNFKEKLKNPRLLILLAILVVITLLYLLKGLLVVAMVNGQPITRLAVVSELEKQSGKQVLDSLVTKTLILQEAQKQHVTASSQEVDTEVAKLTKSLTSQGQSLDQALAMQNMTKADFTDQIKMEILIKKMLGSQIKVTDQEIADYIAKNKDSLPQGQSGDALNQSVRDQLENQKLQDKFQAWLANLQKSAKVVYFVHY